jgi:hypothetical protein
VSPHAPTAPPPASDSKTRRLVAVDVARALAIIGMIAVNVGPQTAEDLLGKVFMLPFGRASLLFMVLAGLGLGLLSGADRSASWRRTWATLSWRAGALFVAGLALQPINHGVSVILAVYGVLFLLAIPLTRLSAATLAVAACLGCVLLPLLWVCVLALRNLPFEGIPVLPSWDLLAVLDGLMLTGPYPALVWIVPLLAGLALSKLNLRSRRVQRRLLAGGLGATAAGLVVSRVLVEATGIDATSGGFARLLASYDHSQAPLWLLSGIGSAVALLGLLLRIEDWLGAHATPLVHLGRLSLTMYVAHLVILALFVRPDPHTTLEGMTYALLISVFCLFAAHAWALRFGQGPLERLLRLPRFRRPVNLTA